MEGKPRVIGIVGLLIVGGLLNLWGGYGIVSTPGLADTFGLLGYFALALGVAGLVAAVLIAMYKRIGLYIGAAIYVLDIIVRVYTLVSGGAAGAVGIVGILIAAAVLYYIYIYLTREPEKGFFT